MRTEPPHHATGRAVYAERLWVPLRWWAVATMFWASVLLAFLVALPPAVAFASGAFLAGLNLVVFVALGRALVAVEAGSFRAGRAQPGGPPPPMRGARAAGGARRAAGVEAD